MAWIDPDRLHAAAARIIDASDADETEVAFDATADQFVRFAGVGPTQSADRQRVDVAVRARFSDGDGIREARATCGSLEPQALDAALGRATELARLSPANSALLPLGAEVEVAGTELDPSTLEHTFQAKADWVSRALRACEGIGADPAGLIRTTGLTRVLLNSAGRAVEGYRSRASFALTASTPTGGAGWAQKLTARVEDLDADDVVARATAKAKANREPQSVEPGEYTVVLEPAALGAMMLFASYGGFGAREVEEGQSFLCGRIGTDVFAPEVSVADDVSHPLSPGIPFDGEGNPMRRVELVERGRLLGPVTDRVYAQKLGVACSGHAQPQPSSSGPKAENLVLSPGNASLEELIGGVDRGLLVTQFHYTNVIDPRELLLTGMTRNGTFLIERGEIVGSVKNLRFTQSLVESLGRVSGIGVKSDVAGALFSGEIVAPPVRIDGFHFTSATEF